jgi:VIT1/CCC1 family predicted Fe2+/Mn2+ transporter
MQSLEEHLASEHRVSPIQTYLKEIVYGGTDGIVTTFAVVAGFTGAKTGALLPNLSFLTVLLFGLANLFADGVSMGLGNFLSLRSEKDIYKKGRAKELHEIRTNPASEKEETTEILVGKGFSRKQAQELTEIYATNERYWLRFMMDLELEMPNPTKENPYLTGLATFSSFVLFGFIPLLPYLLFQDSPQAFRNAIIATFIALLLLGILRWRVTGEHVIRSISEIVLLGAVSAVIAYGVGTLFAL